MDKDFIGIRFEFSHEYMNHLGRLFNELSVENYTWYSSQSENYIADRSGVQLFLPDGVYDGVEFKNLIQNAEYYIHLLCLYGVPKEKPFDPDNIRDYDDYVCSNAEIALFSADSIVDLYAKDSKNLDTIAMLCREHKKRGGIDADRPIKFLTRQNDERTGFYI